MSAGDWKDLYSAALNGDLARVQYHLNAGVNPNYQHPEIMSTPLVASIIAGHEQVTACLLAHGADPNLFSTMDNLTPLEAVEKYPCAASLSRLQEAGAKQRKNTVWQRLFARVGAT
ncbi:MAG: hypothetical protein JJU10_00145 [Idiomarina sp.]|nr:hypothetical protein [Idiomarina sp.]